MHHLESENRRKEMFTFEDGQVEEILSCSREGQPSGLIQDF
jgi:hypothetical protein